MSKLKLGAAALTVLAASGLANALEPGFPSTYPLGVENYSWAALPPPGTYGMVYAGHMEFDKVRNSSGNTVSPPDFNIKVNVVSPRLIWVTPTMVGGASLAFHAIVPLLDSKITAGGNSQSKSGIGDITLGAALGWHHSQSLHTLLALDVFAPTGDYNKNDMMNLGRNHWAIQPLYGVSYINPTGFNADLKAMYTFNFRNNDSAQGNGKYQDGQEFILDYAAGYGLGNGWTLGVGGYYLKQVTNDKLDGVSVANSKAQSFALGPSVRYDSGKGWFVTAKYTQDGNVKNYTEGKAYWLKVVFPL